MSNQNPSRWNPGRIPFAAVLPSALAFSGIVLALLIFGSAEAHPRNISLHPPLETDRPVQVMLRSSVQVRNDFDVSLLNLKIVESSSGKLLANIKSFMPGQTFDLEFAAKGTYFICYSLKKDHQESDMCLQLHVGGLTSV